MVLTLYFMTFLHICVYNQCGYNILDQMGTLFTELFFSLMSSVQHLDLRTCSYTLYLSMCML